MTNNAVDPDLNPSSLGVPFRVCLDWLAGRWDVSATHAVLMHFELGCATGTKTVMWKPSVGKASCEQFGLDGLTYKAVIKETTETAEIQSEVMAVIQKHDLKVTGTFLLAQSAPLTLQGSTHHRSIAFQSDTLWPCTAALVETFAAFRTAISQKPNVLVELRPLPRDAWMLAVYHVLRDEESAVIVKCYLHHRKAPTGELDDRGQPVAVILDEGAARRGVQLRERPAGIPLERHAGLRPQDGQEDPVRPDHLPDARGPGLRRGAGQEAPDGQAAPHPAGLPGA